MKILIVGASGFVGTHLLRHLSTKGHEVEAWSRRAGAPLPGVSWKEVDLLHDVLPKPEGRPWEVVFHLAAYARPSLPWTRDLVFENLDLCARVLDHVAATAEGCRTILTSSAHVYAPNPRPLREDDVVAPRTLYGLSKQLSEAWALSLQSRLDIQIVRPFNQIGLGMAEGLLLTDLMARIRSGESPLAMRGRDDVKDFLAISDALTAYEALLTVQTPSGSIWNLCAGRPVRVSELISAVLETLGRSSPVTFASTAVETLVGDPTKLQAATGWKPRLGLREMVKEAVG